MVVVVVCCCCCHPKNPGPRQKNLLVSVYQTHQLPPPNSKKILTFDLIELLKNLHSKNSIQSAEL